MNDETCDVLPLGYLDNKLTASQRLSLAKSGAIPAALVNERAVQTVMTSLISGGFMLFLASVATQILLAVR